MALFSLFVICGGSVSTGFLLYGIKLKLDEYRQQEKDFLW